MIRIGIIGSGNIVRTRHLAAMRVLRKRITVVGISDAHLDRAKAVAERNSIPHFSSNTKDSIEDIPWLHEVDAVLVATPPFSHGAFVTQALNLGKHVLVEKPFVLDLPEGGRAIALAEERKLILAVNHNFQFSRGFRRLQADLAAKRLGTIRGIYSFQFSNDTRRLPLWSEDLPLGLFYDESPHVFYLLRRFAGDDVAINSVYCVPPTNVTKIYTAHSQRRANRAVLCLPQSTSTSRVPYASGSSRYSAIRASATSTFSATSTAIYQTMASTSCAKS